MQQISDVISSVGVVPGYFGAMVVHLCQMHAQKLSFADITDIARHQPEHDGMAEHALGDLLDASNASNDVELEDDDAINSNNNDNNNGNNNDRNRRLRSRATSNQRSTRSGGGADDDNDDDDDDDDDDDYDDVRDDARGSRRTPGRRHHQPRNSGAFPNSPRSPKSNNNNTNNNTNGPTASGSNSSDNPVGDAALRVAAANMVLTRLHEYSTCRGSSYWSAELVKRLRIVTLVEQCDFVSAVKMLHADLEERCSDSFLTFDIWFSFDGLLEAEDWAQQSPWVHERPKLRGSMHWRCPLAKPPQVSCAGNDDDDDKTKTTTTTTPAACGDCAATATAELRGVATAVCGDCRCFSRWWWSWSLSAPSVPGEQAGVQ
jgi:hypothetical protein